MFRNLILLIGLVGGLLVSAQALSQTCCTGGPPLTGSLNVQALPVNGWGFNLTFDNNYIEDIVQNSKPLPNDNLYRDTQTLVAQFDYGISSKITATLIIPYVWLTQEVRSSDTNERSSGIGDIILLSQYGKTIRSRNSMVIGAGFKIPTGITRHLDEKLGTLLPPTMQPGTGSLDFFFSGQYQYSFKSRPSMSLTQTIHARINTESNDFTFHESYRFGHVVQSFLTLGDQFVIGSLIQNPSLTIRYRFATKDIQEGHPNENTGGHWVYISPGWSVNITKNIITGIIGELPIYRNLNGLQLTTSHKLIATLQILIPSENEDLGL